MNLRSGTFKSFLGRTYKRGNHGTIELNVTITLPVNIQVEVDAARLGLRGQNIGECQGNVAEIYFGKVEACEWPWKHSLKHRIDHFLDDLAPGGIDMWP